MTEADLETRALQGDVRAQVLWAAELDRAGRSYDALDFLARAARADDPEALGVLGRRLVLGSGAPCRPADGIGLLRDAAARGDAGAAAFLAVLAAGGFHAGQNWTAALDFLRRSADLGSEASRRQIEILGSDLKAWLRPPAPRLLRETPRIMAFEGMAPAEACDFIVAQCEGRLVRAEVDDPRTGLPVMGQTRTNRVANFGLGDTCLLNVLLQTRIGAAIGAPFAMMEAFAVLNYRPGEEASDHYDYLDPAIPAYAEEISRVGQRVATALVYLNEDYEDGETDFPELGLGHKGRKGDALVFFSVDEAGAPDPRTRHAGRPPTAGEKWVLSQFVRDRKMVPTVG